MNTQSERRTSKRLAATNDDLDGDDDFVFTRKSKRAKTDEVKEEKPAPATKRNAPKQRAAKTTKAAAPQDTTSPAKPTKKPGRKAARSQPEDESATRGASPEAQPRKHGRDKEKPARRFKNFDDLDNSPPPPEPSVESAKITLPMSDTPIINRNKEMRKKGDPNRRSSLGTRGRRASSLIENGQSALPHRDVNSGEFFKHIAEGLPEPRRMRQLLTWCAERSLSKKPPLGTPNANAVLGARAIQDQLLKDFSARSDFSDWFSRDDDPEKAPIKLQPNPRNMELDEKMTTLEEKIKRLQEEKKAWLAIKKPPPEEPPLFQPEEDQIQLPDFDLLDADDGRIRGYLADEANSISILRSETMQRVQGVRTSLEFQVDLLADNLHKLEQRVVVAGREADRVLNLSASRLKKREERERKGAGTRDMPIMEVLRSLSSILPEGDG